MQPEDEAMHYQHSDPDGSLSTCVVGFLVGAGALCAVVAGSILAGWV